MTGLSNPERIVRNRPYSSEEIALLAKVKPRTICEYCKRGLFPNAVKFGKRWLIPGSDLLDLCPFLAHSSD